MNYFIEGLQGSGKSTLAGRLHELTGSTVFREGDYSPVELAWCAYLDKESYDDMLGRYPILRSQIEEQTFSEGDAEIVCFTKVKTDDGSFYKELERHEIYNGRLPYDRFKDLILTRYKAWNGSGQIFECSLFQNIIEDMVLFRDLSDEEIIDFYRQVRQTLDGKPFRIMYLKTADVAGNLDVIRKERTDENGHEIWYEMMCGFFDNSLHAKNHGVSGIEAMTEHFMHRQELELRICRELFPSETVILGSKGYTDADITI